MLIYVQTIVKKKRARNPLFLVLFFLKIKILKNEKNPEFHG